MALISIFNSGSLEVEKSVEPDSAPAQLPETRTGKAKLLSYSVEELQDLACTAAVADDGLDPVKSRLKVIEKIRRTAIEAEFEEKSSYQKEKLARIQSERDAHLAAIDPEAKRTTKSALESVLAEHKAHISAIMLDASANRSVLEIQEKRRVNQERNVLEEQDLKARVARAEVVRDIHAQDREVNHQCFEQQAAYLQEQQKVLTDSAEIARTKVVELKEIGISRALSAFFVWASSASLVGTGIAALQLMHRALRAGEEKGEDSLLVSWLHNVHTPGDLFRLLAFFLGIVLAAVIVLALFTIATQFFLRRFDPVWRSGADREEGSCEEWSNWLDVFSVSSHMSGKRINDYSLQQIIGVLPVIVAAAAIAFLFVAFGDRSSSELSFVASQIGPAFVLLSLVSVALFVTHVVFSIRIKKPLPLPLNILFGVIALLPLVSLGIAGFAPVRNGTLAITMVAISMVLASSGLVFGLIYRSNFLALDFFEREIDRIQSTIVSLRATPTTRIALALMDDDEQRLEQHDWEVARRSVQSFVSRIRGWVPISWSWPRIVAKANPEIEESVRKLRISGPLLADLNRHRIERDRLESAIAQLSAWELESGEIHKTLASITDKHRAELCDLSIESELALIELEKAYRIASASLGRTPQDGAYAATVGVPVK